MQLWRADRMPLRVLKELYLLALLMANMQQQQFSWLLFVQKPTGVTEAALYAANYVRHHVSDKGIQMLMC